MFFQFFHNEWVGSEPTGFGWIENGLGDEVFTLLIIISGLVNSFCREKIEDELISRTRLESLSLSLFISFGLIIVSTFLVYSINYMYVLVSNLFLIILLFNLIFKFRLSKHYTHEKQFKVISNKIWIYTRRYSKKIGVSRQTINSIENNRFHPSILLCLKLSKELECKVDDLFSLE